MRKFEVGKTYSPEETSAVFEIISRTEKYVTFCEIHHPGRYNERKGHLTKKKVGIWGDHEVLFPHYYMIEA